MRSNLTICRKESRRSSSRISIRCLRKHHIHNFTRLTFNLPRKTSIVTPTHRVVVRSESLFTRSNPLVDLSKKNPRCRDDVFLRYRNEGVIFEGPLRVGETNFKWGSGIDDGGNLSRARVCFPCPEVGDASVVGGHADTRHDLGEGDRRHVGERVSEEEVDVGLSVAGE